MSTLSAARPLLEVRDLSVEFGYPQDPVPVIENISFNVCAGETLGLVGESGCGKSTTAFSILRLHTRASRSRMSGEIRLAGKDLLQVSLREMRQIRGAQIAMIPQDPMSSLNPLFSIGSQISEAVRAHRATNKSETRKDVIRSLERVRIDSPDTRIDQHPHELSGGMRQRIVGAIATSCSPQLLIADEPTTALDVTVQAQYLDVLTELQRESGLAMLFVTHDLGVVARVCDRVAVMYAGQIVETAPVHTIYREPAHWYTRALLDSMPDMHEQVTRLASIPGTPPRPGQSPSGCRFAPRCPAAQDKCRQQEPMTSEIGDQHEIRCWFPRRDSAS